jgi:hypothetical protein
VKETSDREDIKHDLEEEKVDGSSSKRRTVRARRRKRMKNKHVTKGKSIDSRTAKSEDKKEEMKNELQDDARGNVHSDKHSKVYRIIT